MHRPVPWRRAAVVSAILSLGAIPAGRTYADGEAEAKPAAQTPEAALATARALEASFARVEYALRYDDGESPLAISSQGSGDYGGFVTEERPLEAAAVVLAPDRVLAPDACLHPRFVSGVTVVFRGQRVAAKPVAYAAETDAVLLALEKPLEGAVPLAFVEDAKPPFRQVHHGKEEGSWRTTVGSPFTRLIAEEDGSATLDAWSPAVVVDASGRAVGVTMTDELPVGRPWKGSPLSWTTLKAEERDRLVARTEEIAKAGVLRVHLRLRSPKDSSGEGGRYRFSFGDDDEEGDQTERDVAGLVVGERRVLVLHEMDAKTTGRLESVEVHPADGEGVPAKFVVSLRHFGALVVETEKPLEGAVKVSTTPVRTRRHRLLLVARVQVQGEKRVVHCAHARFGTFAEGWRRQVVPEVDPAEHHFFFDREGALVAIPIHRRAPEKVERWRRDEEIALPGEYLAPLLADPVAASDPANVPVVEAREGRLAWLGVELQGLDRELARVNGVSAYTRDGTTGALVSYVYAGSPAATAGLVPGDVVLRVHAADRPKPVDVGGTEDAMSSYRSMFAGLGEDGDFGSMFGIHPWPSVDTELNRTLTEIGFGKPITLEYARAGEVKRVGMDVVEGPVHYEAAPLWKSEPLGLTVRDLTYEVRRHFQLAPAEAAAAEDGKPPAPGVQGVIVSKVEEGGRAAVAGLRRFDIVLRVNDATVSDSAAFAKAVAAEGEIRLGVKDKLKERVVKIGAVAPK